MNQTKKPDLRNGVTIDQLSDGGMLLGQIDGEDAILTRSRNEFFAVGAYCTHYHGLLSDGLVVANTVRCPLHHACFDLRTGEALRAPAFDPIPCWQVEKVGEKVFVRKKLTQPHVKTAQPKEQPTSVVILGGGAAGLA